MERIRLLADASTGEYRLHIHGRYDAKPMLHDWLFRVEGFAGNDPTLSVELPPAE